MDAPDWAEELKRRQATEEILRMVRAVIRDAEVSELEAEFLRFWVAANRELLTAPPLDRMLPVLEHIEDTEAAASPDPAARDELLRILQEVARGSDDGGRPGGG